MFKFWSHGVPAGLLLAATAAFGQAPAFEVASIKAAGPLDPGMMMSGQARIGMNVDGARVDIGNLSLMSLICTAYSVKPYQVTGPAWMSGQRFDIMAKIPEGVGKEHVPEMLQALLADRFKLTVHQVKKEAQIYALIVGKNGPKLTESAPDDIATPAVGGPAPAEDNSLHISGDPQKGMTVSNGLGTGTVKMTMANGAMHLESQKMSMTQLAEALSRFMDHPVVDMTEIKGNYQVGLDVSMEDMMNAARSAGMDMPHGGGGMGGRGAAEGSADAGSSSLFNNVQHLGLKLEARKASSETIVIDHLEKLPTAN